MPHVDAFVWFFFESAAALGSVVGLALFVLLVYWRRTGRGRPLLIALGAGAFLLLVQALVVTQREHAVRWLDRIQVDLVRSRSDALAAALAPDFETDQPRGAALNREAFLDYVQRFQQRLAVRWLERADLRLHDRAGDRFVVSAAYVAEVVGEQLGGAFRSRWSLTFARTPAGWMILHLHAEDIEGVPVPSWDDLTAR